ncbi:hypothetical protein ACIQGZ_02365 [Streptomyces sp. NPDC092296]|uniref:hypothetical protein n=1 Tax=Streptomyces sp. NPDC092296 TaxID=3366012 RepID=UPI0037FE97CD
MDPYRDHPATLARTDQHPTATAYLMPRQDTDRTVLPAGLTPEQVALLLALTHHNPAPAPPAPAPPAAVVDTRVSGRAKGAALVAGAGGTGIGAAATGIGYGAGMISTASGGLMTAALALAIGTGSLTTAVLLLRGALNRDGHRTDPAAPRPGEQPPAPQTHITQNIHSHGMFGRSNGTIHHH